MRIGVIWLFAALVALTSCGPRVQQARSTLSMGAMSSRVAVTPVSPGTTGGNPTILTEGRDNSDMAFLKYLSLCLDDELVFTSAKGKVQEVSPLKEVPQIDLPRGIMTIKMKSLPPGVYKSILVPLHDECEYDKSLIIENSFGRFDSEEDLVLNFQGTFVVPDISEERLPVTVHLDITSLVRALGAVKSESKNGAKKTPIDIAVSQNPGVILVP